MQRFYQLFNEGGESPIRLMNPTRPDSYGDVRCKFGDAAIEGQKLDLMSCQAVSYNALFAYRKCKPKWQQLVV